MSEMEAAALFACMPGEGQEAILELMRAILEARKAETA